MNIDLEKEMPTIPILTSLLLQLFNFIQYSRYPSSKPENVIFSVMATDNRQWVSLESPSIKKSDV